MDRINYSSGAPLEKSVGYSRMVKIGNHVYIGGTTAVQPDGTVYGETVKEQTAYILNKFIDLLDRAGATAKDVFKIKGYVTDMAQVKFAVEAYSEIFKEVTPLFTLVGTTQLNRPTQFIELELEAMIGTTVKETK